MNKIVTKLIIDGLKLDRKNLFLEFKTPKLSPINADSGMHGDSIRNWRTAISWVCGVKLGPNIWIKKSAFKKIIKLIRLNIRDNFKVDLEKIKPYEDWIPFI